MTGVETNVFQPDAPLTRGMFASVIYRLAGSPDVTYKNIFSDVPVGKWYSNVIIWAYENGIVAGLGNDRYGTNENITREQLARMLMEYAKVQGYNISERADFGKFADASQVSRWADENAVCTDLLDDETGDILKVSEGRWQIEECFRIMKTDFSARPVYLQDENRIKAHFLICFLALTLYRFLEKRLNSEYTCEELLDTLKSMNFAGIQEQGYIPLYRRDTITDSLHEVCGFRTDYQFITKSKMRTIQKKSKGKE